MGQLDKLPDLNLSNNKKLVRVPKCSKEMTSLTKLDVGGCDLDCVAQGMGQLEKLCDLNLSNNKRLMKLREGIEEMKSLIWLDVGGCDLDCTNLEGQQEIGEGTRVHQANDLTLSFSRSHLGDAATSKEGFFVHNIAHKANPTMQNVWQLNFDVRWCHEIESGDGGDAEVFDEDKDDDVVVLGADNFTEFLNTNPYVLVDATVHAELAKEFGVQSYPTILFFIDGVPKRYTGERASDGIVAWVKKKTGPAISVVKSSADAEELLKEETTLAVAFLDDFEVKDAEELTAVARQEDGILFYMTGDVDKKAPALVLLKKQNEKLFTFDGAFERKEISGFLSANKLPLVVTFSHETASAIFEDEVSRQLLLFALPEEFEKIRDNFEEAAKSFKRKIIFVLVDLANKQLSTPVLHFFALTADETKMIGFTVDENGLNGVMQHNHLFAYTGTLVWPLYDFYISQQYTEVFGEMFLTGDLCLKSEPIPQKVYAPWFGHCKKLEPEYNRLGEVLQNIPSIVIAKMDGTKNEHALVQVKEFPTILFFPAGNKSKEPPLSVDMDRTVEAFVEYIKKNAAIPFTVPEIPEVKQEVSVDLGRIMANSEFVWIFKS
ncbi:hypothetical protein BDL97_01G023100 [Sphagnum fallax]|nr:hypothetical protein BDL97_01G023100 [Sphagnum fallax]